MALRNLFGEVGLESTQFDIKMDHGELLLCIYRELVIANKHLAAISGERVQMDEINGEVE
jgi:hypothetical protein